MVWLILIGIVLIVCGYLNKSKDDGDITIRIVNEDGEEKGRTTIKRRSDEESEESRRVNPNGGGHGPIKGWGKFN